MDWEEEEEEEEEEAEAVAGAGVEVKVKAEAEAVAVGELPYANRAPRQRNLSFDRRQERTWLKLHVAILVHRRKRREGPIARAPQDCRARAHSG